MEGEEEGVGLCTFVTLGEGVGVGERVDPWFTLPPLLQPPALAVPWAPLLFVLVPCWFGKGAVVGVGTVEGVRKSMGVEVGDPVKAPSLPDGPPEGEVSGVGEGRALRVPS